MSVEEPNSSQEVFLIGHFWVVPIPSLHVKVPRLVKGHWYESDFLFSCRRNSLKQRYGLLNIIAICIHTLLSVRRFCDQQWVIVLTARWTCKYICVSSRSLLLTADCVNFFLFKSSLVCLWNIKINIRIHFKLRIWKSKLVDQLWTSKRWCSRQQLILYKSGK